MLWTKGDTERSGSAVVCDPTCDPVLALLGENPAGEEETTGSDKPRFPRADLTETSPIILMDARDSDEEEEEEEEEDADFFDDEEEDEDDLDDDLEDEDFEDDEFEDEDEDDEEDEDEDDEF